MTTPCFVIPALLQIKNPTWCHVWKLSRLLQHPDSDTVTLGPDRLTTVGGTTSLTEQALAVSPSQPSAPDVDVWSRAGAPAALSSISLLLERMAPSWNSQEKFLACHTNAHIRKHTPEWPQSGWMKIVPAAGDAPHLISSGSCQLSDCEKFCPQTNRKGNTELL